MKNKSSVKSEKTEKEIPATSDESINFENDEDATAVASENDEDAAAPAPQKQKLTKKKKITMIVASVLIAAIIVAALCVKFIMFNDPVYDVDLQQVVSKTPAFIDEFDSFNDKVWQKEVYYDYSCEACGNVTIGLPEKCKNCGNDNQEKYIKGDYSPRRGGYWTEDSVLVEDGTLVLRTKKDGDRWVTGAVNSLGTKTAENVASGEALGLARTYGYYELSCKLPAGYGIWSAFWMMGLEYGGVPDKDASKYGAEIDIFEAPCWPKSSVQQAIHVGKYDHPTHDSIFNPRWTMDKYDDLYGTFHTYGFYWNSEIYKFYIDGDCVWTTHFGHNVAQVDEYIMLSVEIGGENGKIATNPWRFVGGKMITANPEGDAFRSDFVIDYLKVWDI